ncbi:hypothetical protein ABLE68_07600 [Nocardioides sp. CN2-186]|uniref:hypothetical protein n=1 Tax=Nocardioides tweenelious TaxID=3156607 RepID=UPI0032B3EC30
MPPASPSDYRLAPAVGARVVGGMLVGLAALLFAATALVAVLGLPVDALVVLTLVGVVALFVAGYVITARLAVVHLGAEGYRVRLVRGAGVKAAAWTEVTEAVTASPGGLPVVVLKLTDSRTTTIPVTILAADREEFVRDLQAHLKRGQGLRPLS